MADDTSEDQVANPTSAQAEDWQAQLQTAVFGAAAFETEEIDETAEEVRLRTKWFGILHPETTVRSCYDALQIIILCYLAWLLPTRLAFSLVATGIEVVTDLLIDMAVWLDMLLHMNSFYYDSKTKRLVTDKKKIKRDSLRSW